ncbi:SRF-like protein [Dendrothele bispora CBS 962.96]|uniref:SRF-like protein n=1 Tax=Dendrothele bispora (strain CBS 962.96) TaxID=1314807 RepID=A0A4S8L953_DENBC|nr:SRF-like protein [Dendrothele bispora CBS 962.96]
MGRRKIEIQPITHERNRSVTFLKRKNGLFKKAYELGVLCSVDVAVIIFDEKPGQQHKLYEYCSGDVRDIVRRHLRFNGDKDSRGPGDFNGTGPSKMDDLAEGDDDDDDDDVPAPATTTKGGKAGKGGSAKKSGSKNGNSGRGMEERMDIDVSTFFW